jgi:hypothetical protein
VRNLSQRAACGLAPAAWVGLIVTLCGVAASPSGAQGPTDRPRGLVRGVVVADVPTVRGRGSIPIPNAQVTVADATGPTPGGKTSTRLDGRFSTPMQPAGGYRVCAKAAGFAEGCSQLLQITTDSVALSEPLALKPQDGVLHGHISLQDGTFAVRPATAQDTTAGAAQVSLTDAQGRLIAGPVSVNAGGDYVLAPVAAAPDLVLSVRYGGAAASQTVTLSQTDLDEGKPVDVALPGEVPKVTSVTMTQDGKPVTSVAPGSTVVLTVNVRDGGLLHYSWISNTAGLAAEDAPSVTMTLPNAPVGAVVFVEITNEIGAVAQGSITIPLISAPTLEPKLQFRPINLPTCIFGTYCIPRHQGLFIDPTDLMQLVCNSEQSCETEATNYYKAIGALDANGNATQFGTFKGWKAFYGFGADPNSPTNGEVRATYYNNADLGFGRDMHCRSGTFLFDFYVACYVSNYGDGTNTFGSDPQTAISRAANNIGRIATVAMVYTFCQGGSFFCGTQPQKYRVQFYVFTNSLNNDPNDGSLSSSAALDSEKQKAVPGLCLDCHGGVYGLDAQNKNTVHQAENANFLPFDAPSFIFSNSSTSQLESSQRDVIRQLNALVKSATYVRPTISELIDGWYQWCGGVGANGCYIDDVSHPFYPTQPCPSGLQRDVSCGWPPTWGGALAQSFYQHVPRVYCRTCHVAQADSFNIDSFEDWKAKVNTIKLFVFASQSNPPGPNHMPFAERPYNAFWLDFEAQSAMFAFLSATGP